MSNMLLYINLMLYTNDGWFDEFVIDVLVCNIDACTLAREM